MSASDVNITALVTNPTYINANHNAAILAAAVIWSILTTIALCLRLAAKMIRRTGLEADDIFLVVSYVFCLGQNILVATSITYGEGHHILTLSPKNRLSFAKAFFASSVLQPVILTAAKLSVLVLLDQIFITRGFKITARILGIILILWFIATQLCQFLICRPLSVQWNPETPGNCGNQHLLTIMAPIPWILTDFAILIAPIPVLKSLRLPSTQKYGVMVLFLMGGVTCIISVLRYKTLFYSEEDVSYDTPPVAIWQVTEANVTLICASMLAARPAVAFLYPEKIISRTQSAWSRYLGSKNDKSTNSQQNGIIETDYPFGSATNLQHQPKVNSHHEESWLENGNDELEELQKSPQIK